MNLKKFRNVFTSKSVGTGHTSYEKKNLPGRGLTKVQNHCSSLRWNGKNLVFMSRVKPPFLGHGIRTPQTGPVPFK